MTIDETQEEIVEEFGELDDWMDKYQMLIDMAGDLAPLAASEKTEQNLIDGCQSRVWLVAEQENGRLSFRAESDALIVGGIAALLLRALNGHTPQEILDADLWFIDRIGLRDHLSPTRSNGLLAMMRQMRAWAVALSMKE